MLIRCSRCRALYSVQDAVAQGAAAFPVECGRCLLVFAAQPARRISSAPPAVAPTPPPPPAPPPLQLIRSPELPPPPPSDALEHAVDIAEVPADPFLEASLRARRKMAAIAGVAIAVLGVGIWRIAVSGMPRVAREKIVQAEQKLLRDDTASLESAAALLDEAREAAPGEARPEGGRGFVLLLDAYGRRDLASRLERRSRELAEQAAKAQAAREYGQADKWNAQIAAIGPEREALLGASARLMEQGAAAAKAALEDDPRERWGLRAMALYCGLTFAPDRGRRYLAEAEKSSSIPWDALVHATLGDDPPGRLAQALAAERRMLRARVELAGLLADKGQPRAAREQLDEVVKENPQHDRAKRMLALLPGDP